MTTLRVKCPACGGGLFVLPKKADSYEDFIGAPCDKCGHVLTNDEIKGQAVDSLRERIAKTIKGAWR